MSCLLSPRPRLKHGRQLALLSHLYLRTLSFVLSLALLPHLLTSQTIFPRESASIFAVHLRSHFFVFQSKAPRSRTKDNHSELGRATCSKESYSSFCSPFPPAEFLGASTNFSSSIDTGSDNVAYLILKHFPSSG